MSVFKSLILFTLCLTAYAANVAAQAKNAFSYPHSITRAFLVGADTIAARLREVRVFKASFEDKYVETDGVIDAVPYNKYMKQPKVTYLPQPIGYRQELYLLQLISANSSDHFIYFTVWYKQRFQQMGFGPAYIGSMDTLFKNIRFEKGLVMKDDEENPGGLRLVPVKQSRRFVMTMPAQPDSAVIVNRIVLFENNKIGGRKRIVFKVSDHLKMDNLVFERLYPALRP
jgi:hypothetical protein